MAHDQYLLGLTFLARGSVDNIWNIALAGVPFGLSVVSINIGKHIDKSAQDKVKGVGTLPVRLGEKTSRFFTPVMLIVFFAGKRLLLAIGVHTKPRPSEPPKEWPGWPTWFSGFTFYHNRLFSNLFVLGIFVDVLLRLFVQSFWPMR